MSAETWGIVICFFVTWHVLDRFEDIAKAAKSEAPTRSLVALTAVALAWLAWLVVLLRLFFVS